MGTCETAAAASILCLAAVVAPVQGQEIVELPASDIMMPTDVSIAGGKWSFECAKSP